MTFAIPGLQPRTLQNLVQRLDVDRSGRTRAHADAKRSRLLITDHLSLSAVPVSRARVRVQDHVPVQSMYHEVWLCAGADADGAEPGSPVRICISLSEPPRSLSRSKWARRLWPGCLITLLPLSGKSVWSLVT